MTTRGRTVRLATRGSDLALRQAATVEETLVDKRFDVELVEVETTGDQIQDELIHRLGKTGAFVRRLDQKVLDGELDAAVHSMKDMPTEQPDNLVVAGVPGRAAPTDVLVTPDGTTLAELPEEAVVGTSSLRRQAQLLTERPDLDVQPLRGNVDTRLAKLLASSLQREHERRLEAQQNKQDENADGDVEDEKSDGDGSDAQVAFEQSIEEWFNELSEIERQAMEQDSETEYDAIVLARAGLERTGLSHHIEFQELPTDRFVPAPGQGALAVTALDSELAQEIQEALDHPPTRVATSVERIVLDELGGGCVAPIGVYAELRGDIVHTSVSVHNRDGTESVTATRDLPVDRHPSAARDLAAALRDEGAAALIEQARRETADEAKRKE